MNEKKAHVLQKVHKLTNTFVKDKFPDEEHRLEWMWRQMEQSLLPLLVETHPREWTFEQPQITDKSIPSIRRKISGLYLV